MHPVQDARGTDGLGQERARLMRLLQWAERRQGRPQERHGWVFLIIILSRVAVVIQQRDLAIEILLQRQSTPARLPVERLREFERFAPDRWEVIPPAPEETTGE